MATSKAEFEPSKKDHPHVVSKAEWLAARKELLTQEKEFTRARDALSAKRRELPWVKIEKPYSFDTPGGKKTLADLFEGRSQLIVYHFMFGPEWEEGCPGCSMAADTFNGNAAHLSGRDVALTAVSRAPLSRIEAFKKRMGWQFKWASSSGSDFNSDFGVTRIRPTAAGWKICWPYTSSSIVSRKAAMRKVCRNRWPGLGITTATMRGSLSNRNKRDTRS